MGLRETLNKNPLITTWATVGIVVLALIIIGWQLIGRNKDQGLTVSEALSRQRSFRLMTAKPGSRMTQTNCRLSITRESPHTKSF